MESAALFLQDTERAGAWAELWEREVSREVVDSKHASTDPYTVNGEPPVIKPEGRA
jgi:hypothetical protein